jgi:hypothetical protein
VKKRNKAFVIAAIGLAFFAAWIWLPGSDAKGAGSDNRPTTSGNGSPAVFIGGNASNFTIGTPQAPAPQTTITAPNNNGTINSGSGNSTDSHNSGPTTNYNAPVTNVYNYINQSVSPLEDNLKQKYPQGYIAFSANPVGGNTVFIPNLEPGIDLDLKDLKFLKANINQSKKSMEIDLPPTMQVRSRDGSVISLGGAKIIDIHYEIGTQILLHAFRVGNLMTFLQVIDDNPDSPVFILGFNEPSGNNSPATSNISDNHSASLTVGANNSGTIVQQNNSPNGTVTITTNKPWEISPKQSGDFIKLAQGLHQENSKIIQVYFTIESSSQDSWNYALALQKMLSDAGYDSSAQFGTRYSMGSKPPAGLFIALAPDTKTPPETVSELCSGLSVVGINFGYITAFSSVGPSTENAISMVVGDKPQ